MLAGPQAVAAAIVAPPQTSSLVYGLAALDDRGRIADRAMGWNARQRLAIAEADGVLTVRTDPNGDYQARSRWFHQRTRITHDTTTTLVS